MINVQIIDPKPNVEGLGYREGGSLASYINQTNMNVAANRA